MVVKSSKEHLKHEIIICFAILVSKFKRNNITRASVTDISGCYPVIILHKILIINVYNNTVFSNINSHNSKLFQVYYIGTIILNPIVF